jgi:hypothetical protein
MVILHPIRIIKRFKEYIRKLKESIPITEIARLSIKLSLIASISDYIRLLIKLIREESVALSRKMIFKLKGSELISISEATGIHSILSLVASIADYMGILLRLIKTEAVVLSRKLAFKLKLAEYIVISELTKITTIIQASSSIADILYMQFRTTYSEAVSMGRTLFLYLKSLRDILSISDIAKRFRWIGNKTISIVDTVIHRFLHYLTEAVSIGTNLIIKLKGYESLSIGDLAREIGLQLGRVASIADEFLLRLKTSFSDPVTLLKTLILRVRGSDSVSIDDKMYRYILRTGITSSLVDSLYYEIYPYIYSLDIVEGYPAKTFPSLDISTIEVKIYGEVTVS